MVAMSISTVLLSIAALVLIAGIVGIAVLASRQFRVLRAKGSLEGATHPSILGGGAGIASICLAIATKSLDADASAATAALTAVIVAGLVLTASSIIVQMLIDLRASESEQ